MCKLRKSEAGNTALYVVVALPVAITLAVVGADLSAWQSLRQNAQREADRIAYEASMFLPNEALAGSHIAESVASLPQMELARDPSGEPIVEISTSSVSLTVKVEHESVFDVFLTPQAGEHRVFTAYAAATASTVPQDIFLIISDSSSLRPDAFSAWGSALDWPASSYFSLIGQPAYSFDPPNQPPLYWPEWWENDFFSESYRRWATQLCFNPVVTPLKLTAIRSFDVLGSGRLNRVGILFTPGDVPGGAGFTLGRKLSFADEDAALTEWSTFYEPRSANGDEGCVYLADESTTTNSRYAPPEPPFNYIQSGTSVACDNRIRLSPLGDPHGHQPDPALGRLAPCFTGGGATAQELIYFHAMRPHAHQTDGANITRAAAYALANLIEGSHLPSEEAQNRRRNLTTKIIRRILVLTDFLPDPGEPEFSALIAETEQTSKSAHISFIVFQHPNLPVSTRALNEARAASINAASPYASAQLASNAEELNRLSGSFIHRGRQLALRG